MPDKGTPPDGEHIDELLSQLKGIFGHLSDSEKEEAKQKIVPPSMPPRSVPTPPVPPPVPTPPILSESMPPVEELTPSLPAEPPADAPELPALEPWTPLEPASQAVPSAPPSTSDEFVVAPVSVPDGASLVPAAIFYPTLRIAEAKIVAEKVERITPKFTKVAFVLNVQSMVPYDVKADLKSTIVTQVSTNPLKALFILMEKSLDEPRRKAIVAELESRGIYFQEIPFHQVEKKAIYTDMLLGMVFFFDSQKPAAPDANP